MTLPLEPLLPTSDDTFQEWALQRAYSVNLGKIAREYPEQFVRAAAAARATLRALEEDLPGRDMASRPTWELS